MRGKASPLRKPTMICEMDKTMRPVSGLRLRRVRFKDGRAPLEIIRAPQDDWTEAVRRGIESVVRVHPTPAGCAIVIWNADGGSTAQLVVTRGSPVMPAMVPRFAEERLRLWLAELWTRQGIGESGKI